MNDAGDCIYIFLDESGNLDFGANGTRYFVMTSVAMTRPFSWFDSLDGYKYDCIEYGLPGEYFHCAEDNRHVRARVLGIIRDNITSLRIDNLIVEKETVPANLQEAREFYPTVLGQLLSEVVAREVSENSGEVIVITDTIPLANRRQAIERAAHTTLSRLLPEGARYRLLHHQSRSHYGLQVTDYCCWAVHRKWQTGESHWLDFLQQGIRSETLAS